MMRLIALGAVAFLLAACATAGPSTQTSAPAAATAPRAATGLTGPVDLGDWRRGDANAILQRFSGHVLRRWPAGQPISTAVADLRSQGFSCAAPRGQGGDPPDQSCRLTRTEAGCTYIWTVSLYDDAGATRLSRVRPLFDKRCGRDGLAGGPD